jgi:hypothetical protein
MVGEELAQPSQVSGVTGGDHRVGNVGRFAHWCQPRFDTRVGLVANGSPAHWVAAPAFPVGRRVGEQQGHASAFRRGL